MTWTAKWSGGFPLYRDSAAGVHLTDVDSLTYADFALGDTGAMAGHAPPAVLHAVGCPVPEHGLDVPSYHR
jgi:glutamate-1-semialdehyde 2,1-aminomutase